MQTYFTVVQHSSHGHSVGRGGTRQNPRLWLTFLSLQADPKSWLSVDSSRVHPFSRDYLDSLHHIAKNIGSGLACVRYLLLDESLGPNFRYPDKENVPFDITCRLGNLVVNNSISRNSVGEATLWVANTSVHHVIEDDFLSSLIVTKISAHLPPTSTILCRSPLCKAHEGGTLPALFIIKNPHLE